MNYKTSDMLRHYVLSRHVRDGASGEHMSPCCVTCFMRTRCSQTLHDITPRHAASHHILSRPVPSRRIRSRHIACMRMHAHARKNMCVCTD